MPTTIVQFHPHQEHSRQSLCLGQLQRIYYSVVIRNLNPGTQYRILVSAHTTAGVAGEQALTDRPLNLMIVGPTPVEYTLPLVTTEPPAKSTTNICAIVGAIIAVLFIIVISTAFIIVVVLIVRRRKNKVEFEKNRYKCYSYQYLVFFCTSLHSLLHSRMLRAFDQPAGIMLTKQERQSMDLDKEQEV